MKGLELPINMIVIIAVAVLVLVAISIFFVAQSGSGLSKIDAQGVFANGCTLYCKNDPDENWYEACGAGTVNDGSPFSQKFVEACKTLGYIKAADQCVDCLKRCGTSCGTRDLQADTQAQFRERAITAINGGSQG